MNSVGFIVFLNLINIQATLKKNILSGNNSPSFHDKNIKKSHHDKI